MSLASNPIFSYPSLVLFLLIFLIGGLEGVSVNESNIEVPIYLYKVVSKKHWEKSEEEKELFLRPVDDAFIHFSEEHQVDRIIKKFFSDCMEVVVLKIDASLLKGKLVKERNPGGENKYFHLYDGSIPFDSILEVEMTPSS